VGDAIAAAVCCVWNYRLSIFCEDVSIHNWRTWTRHTTLKKNGSEVRKKEFSWEEIKFLHIVDFEDNHYCNLEFFEKKNNLVLHRDTGEFEKFYREVRRRMTIQSWSC
jgi:hypothetical protein